MGRYQKKQKTQKIGEKQAGALWGTMGRYRNALKMQKNTKNEKRKNCKNGPGHYGALSKKKKPQKIGEKQAGALWGTMGRYRNTLKMQKNTKTKKHKIAKNGPGHYGALSKKQKTQKIGEKQAGALWGTMGRYRNTLKNAKNTKNEKTQKLQKTGRGTMGRYQKKQKTQKIGEKQAGALWGTMGRYRNTWKCKNARKAKK